MITKANNDESSGNQDGNNNDQRARNDAPPETRTQEATRTAVHVQKQSPRLGQADILNTIGMSEQNDKSLVERKKQQWKQELGKCL